jgi:uncharacterized membrane protein required for colicin V production
MNILDLIMSLILVVGVAVGFVRGLVQQALGLLSIYISMVVGVWAHRLFGSGFKALFPALSQPAANMLGFTTALIILLNALGLITRDIEKNAAWVKKIPPLLNQTGGLALGFITSTFWLGLAGTALTVISRAPWLGAEEAHQSLVTLVDNSVMVSVFRYAFRLGLYTIYPWIPGELPEIFTIPF